MRQDRPAPIRGRAMDVMPIDYVQFAIVRGGKQVYVSATVEFYRVNTESGDCVYRITGGAISIPTDSKSFPELSCWNLRENNDGKEQVHD